MNRHGGYTGTNAAMLDFSININPLGMPSNIKQTIIESLDGLEKYPEITGETARQKLASDIGMSASNIILGNGAIELIYLFARSLHIQRAIILTPTFNEYRRALEMNGCTTIVPFLLTPENDFEINTSALLEQLRFVQPEAVFICNPTNPTGKLYSKERLKSLIEAANPEIYWFVDESFIEFSSAEESLKSEIDSSKNQVFILRSLTKFFGMPGLRIGYGMGNVSIIQKMEAFKEPWTINALALQAATMVYEEVDYIENTRKLIAEERNKVYNALRQIKGIKPYKSATDFHLIQTDMAPTELLKALNGYNINVRTCEDFPGLEEHFIRAAIKNPEANEKFIQAMMMIFKKGI